MRATRDVAVVGYAQHVADEDTRSEPEMLVPVFEEALGPLGLTNQDMDFTVSGSSDYLSGQPFSFVGALDAVGAWPPLAESHVEMDGAFALFEAWVRLQMGDIDTALVYAFGRSSPGDPNRVLAIQLDPYLLAPLFPDAVSLAALQARVFLESDGYREEDVAEVVARARGGTVDELLAAPYLAPPLRAHDLPPVTDGCAAVVLAAGDRARDLVERPAWIRGIDHRIEAHALGVRDLTRSDSTALAARNVGVSDGPVDLAELHAPFSFQELIVRDAIGLDGGTVVNPSGGALTSNPIMVAGLQRIGEAATRLSAGEGQRAVAHATSGPCLQQNLVAVLEVE